MIRMDIEGSPELECAVRHSGFQQLDTTGRSAEYPAAGPKQEEL